MDTRNPANTTGPPTAARGTRQSPPPRPGSHHAIANASAVTVNASIRDSSTHRACPPRHGRAHLPALDRPRSTVRHRPDLARRGHAPRVPRGGREIPSGAGRDVSSHAEKDPRSLAIAETARTFLDHSRSPARMRLGNTIQRWDVVSRRHGTRTPTRHMARGRRSTTGLPRFATVRQRQWAWSACRTGNDPRPCRETVSRCPPARETRTRLVRGERRARTHPVSASVARNQWWIGVFTNAITSAREDAGSECPCHNP